MFTLHSLQVPPPGRVQQYTAGPPMAATGPPSMAATGPALPPPVPVVGTLIVRGKFEFRSVSEIGVWDINVGGRREGGITCTCTVLYDNCVDGLFCA